MKKNSKNRLTAKEVMIFALARFNKLDDDGKIKDTKMNRWIYKTSCKLAGGEDQLGLKCFDIMLKLKDLGIDLRNV